MPVCKARCRAGRYGKKQLKGCVLPIELLICNRDLQLDLLLKGGLQQRAAQPRTR